MNKIMYELRWHFINEDTFTSCSIYPITVLSQIDDVIIAKDKDGHKFQGGIEDYYETELEAFNHMKEVIAHAIHINAKEIADLTVKNHELKTYLDKLNKQGMDALK